jgi:hypothetical protein
MINPVFQRFRELIVEVAPRISPDEVRFDVQLDDESVVHVFDCITGNTTPTSMSLRDLETSDVCHVGLYMRDGLLPDAMLAAITDRQLAQALAVRAVAEQLVGLDPTVLQQARSDEFSAVEFATWFNRTAEQWLQLLDAYIADTHPRFGDKLDEDAHSARTILLGLHARTVGHPDTRSTLGMHQGCVCPVETVVLEPLSAVAFHCSGTSSRRVERELGRIHGLLSSFKDAAVQPGSLYDLPACVVDLVATHMPSLIRSPRFRDLPAKVRHTAEALWTPDTWDPFTDFSTAVAAAEKLVTAP